MHELKAVFVNNLRATWTMPVWVVLALVYPLMWLLLFGQLFRGVAVAPSTAAAARDFDYLTYFTPGMVAATTVFGALWAGFGIALDRDSGVLGRILASPMRRGAVVAAYVLPSLSSVLAQALVILGLAAALGARISWSARSLAAMLGVVLVLGFCLSAFSHLMALLSRRQETLVSTINFLSLPALFVSSALYPLGEGPRWMALLAELNPVHHGSELIRSIALPGFEVHAYGRLAFLVIAGVLFQWAATALLRGERWETT